VNVIILAAGFGSRLKDLTKDRTKGLVQVGNLCLIDYALKFTEHNKIEKRIIVGGYTFDRMKAHIEKVNPAKTILLENKEFNKGSILTLNAAREYLNTDFLLMNVDHIYNPAMMTKIVGNIKGITAIVDFDRDFIEDDMKVKLNERGQILKIDKKLTDFDGGYIGMTTVSKESLKDYLEALDAVLRIKGENAVVEPILQYLTDNGKQPNSLDLSGYQWFEVNTDEERQNALARMAENPERFPY